MLLDVGEVQTHQFADPQPAVEEQRQDTVIPLLIFAVHGVQELDALVQGQVFGQGFLQFRRIHI
ncbi:50S ribosomal protein L28, partial [Dysosmobacter welbionis]